MLALQLLPRGSSDRVLTFYANMDLVGKEKPTYDYRSFAMVDWILGLLVCRRLETGSVDVPLAGQGRGAVLCSSFHELDWRG
jgi:hypothetical protein